VKFLDKSLDKTWAAAGASHLCKWIDFRSAGILPASELSIMQMQKWDTPGSGFAFLWLQGGDVYALNSSKQMFHLGIDPEKIDS
jgi:hypothetical protein